MTTPNEVGLSLQVRNRIAFTRDMKVAEKNVDDFGDAAERADTKVKASTKSNKDFDSGLRSLIKGLTAGILGVAALRGAMALVKWPAMIVGARVAAGTISALSAGVVGLTSALTPLAGLLATYPSLLAAGAQGMGVFKLATYGIDDALQNVFGTAEEFQESIKGLPPAAQEFARTVRTFEPMFERLRTIAAAGIFPSATELLKGLRPLEGLIARFVRRTSGVLGGLINRVGGITSSGGFATDLRAVMGSNVRILDNLGNAGINLAQAFRDVLVEVQPLTRWLSRLALRGSEAFKSFIQGERQSGGLRGFFHETRKVTSQILSIAGNLGQVLANVLGAGYGLGRNLLGVLDRLTAQWAEWAGSVGGQNALKQWFDDARPVIMQIGRLVGDIAVGFMEVSRMPGLPGLIRKLRTDLLPVITDIFKTGTGKFGRTLIDLAVEAGRLFKVLGTESGPLTAFLRTISTVLRVVNNLIESTGTGGLVATLLTLKGVMSAFKFLNFLNPLRGILGVFRDLPDPLAKTTTKAGLLRRGLTRLGGVIGGGAFAGGGITLAFAAAAGATWLFHRRLGNLQTDVKKAEDNLWKLAGQQQDTRGATQRLDTANDRLGEHLSAAAGGPYLDLVDETKNAANQQRNLKDRMLDTFPVYENATGKIINVAEGAKKMMSAARNAGVAGKTAGENIRDAMGKALTPLGQVRSQFGDLYDAIAKLPKNVQLQVSTNAGRLASGIGDAAAAQANSVSIGGGGGGGGLASSWAQQAMSAVPGSQSITSTYRSPAANAAVGGSPTSYHMDASNPAQDIVGSNLSAVASYLQQFPVRELLWQVPGHYDHVHVAARGMHKTVSQPTMIMAGEAGRERVDITPVKTDSSRGRGDGVGAGSVYQRGAIQINSGAIQINGVNDPEKIGKGVLRFIEDRIARS